MTLSTLIGSCLLACTLVGANAQAASLNQSFSNDFDTNAIYLWSDDPSNMQFEQVRFSAAMAGWNLDVDSASALVLSGPAAAAGAGRFTVKMDYQVKPFSMQWAEVFFDSGINRILGGGTLTYRNGGWSGSDVFTRAGDIPHQFSAQSAVPLPPSIVLLLSALAFFPLRRYVRVRS